MNPLQLILQIIGMSAAAAAPFLEGRPQAEAIDKAAQALASIAANAAQAYAQVAGKPLDLSTLQPIDPVA